MLSSVLYYFCNMLQWDCTFPPALPENWQGYHFRIRYHGSLLEVSVNKETCSIEQLEGTAITVELYGKEYVLEAANQKVEVPYQEN